MASSNKKRKRDPVAAESTDQVKLVNAEASDLPPVAVTTVGVALPPLPFKPYTRPSPYDTTKKKRARPEYLLHGSNPRLDYEGREVPEDSQYHRYYVGIFNPATNSVSLHLAPRVHVTSSIRAHRQRDVEVLEKGSEFNFAESRIALGKAFGTRKAQNALTSWEINKVDAADMDQSVSNAIIEQVEENTMDLPTTEELGRNIQDERPIPKHNATASRVDEVYAREDVISEEEWESIWVSDWVKNGTVNTNSTHVNKRAVQLIQSSPKGNARELKMLKYIASLVDFYLFQQKGRGRLPPLWRAKTAFNAVNSVLIESFYKKFTETTSSQVRRDEQGRVKDNGDRYVVSPRLEQKILYYLAVLCLTVDKFDVDIYDLKHDLNIVPKELAQVFKEVGCSIKNISKAQLAASKMTKAEAAQHKRAVLKIPLEFPPPPRKRATAGGRR